MTKADVREIRRIAEEYVAVEHDIDYERISIPRVEQQGKVAEVTVKVGPKPISNTFLKIGSIVALIVATLSGFSPSIISNNAGAVSVALLVLILGAGLVLVIYMFISVLQHSKHTIEVDIDHEKVINEKIV